MGEAGMRIAVVFRHSFTLFNVVSGREKVGGEENGTYGLISTWGLGTSNGKWAGGTGLGMALMG